MLSHGGPTSNASTALDLTKQFMTSRGIAVVDVDYGGSTGYGREYRRRLDGQWGVVDVDDCVAAARYLVERGDVDPDRLAIEGGSAGGYTTLAALAFRDVFAAGISHFGIGDLELLDTDTHKFESRYNDRLVGPYPERGRPLPRALADPLPGPLLGPGPDPPGPRRPGRAAIAGRGDRRGAGRRSRSRTPTSRSRARATASAARSPIRRTLEARLSFLGQVFGFEPADAFEPLELPGLDAWLARHPRRVAVGATSGAGSGPRSEPSRSQAPADGARSDRVRPDRTGPRPVRRDRRPGLPRAPGRRRLSDPARPRRARPRLRCPGLPAIELEPDVVFLLLLPPILFGAAYSTPIRDFKANARPIALLAVGLVLFTTVVVGIVVVPAGPVDGPGAGVRARGDRRAARRGGRDLDLPAHRRPAADRDDPRGREPGQRRVGADRLPVRGRGRGDRHLRRWPTPASRSSSSGSAGSWSGCWSASS